MTADFAPRLDILPPPQRRLWDELAAVPGEFVLYGGTALALHLGHRESLDFDFSGNKPLDPAKLVPAVSFLDGAIVTQREPNTFSCTVDRGGVIKLSFFGLPGFPRLLPPLIASDNGLQVASLLDLAGTKASVVQVRAEAKDYIDIDALLTHTAIDLATALSAARAIYGTQFNPQSTLKALCYFDEGNLRRLSQSVKDRLVKAACEVDLAQLPMISGRSIDNDPGLAR
jgi:Nucleotidyl transferase AbiEii toxin, Type IV TA system